MRVAAQIHLGLVLHICSASARFLLGVMQAALLPLLLLLTLAELGDMLHVLVATQTMALLPYQSLQRLQDLTISHSPTASCMCFCLEVRQHLCNL